MPAWVAGLAFLSANGLNVNLYWGGFMTVCGLAALYLARRKGRRV